MTLQTKYVLFNIKLADFLSRASVNGYTVLFYISLKHFKIISLQAERCSNKARIFQICCKHFRFLFTICL